MTTDAKADVLVIGAGVLGLLTALRLQQQGRQVTLLDQALPGQAASWAGGGILSPLPPWHYDNYVNRLAALSAQHYPTLAQTLYDQTGFDIELTPSGLLVTGETANVPTSWQAPSPYFAVERVDSADARFQLVATDLLPTARYLSHVCQLRNPRLVKALSQAVISAGVQVVPHTKVQRLRVRNQQVQAAIDAAGVTWQAEQFVLCGGSWSGLLAQTWPDFLKQPVSIWPVRGQMLRVEAPAGWLSHIVLHDGLYIIPRRDGQVLIGSTLEQVGFDTRIDAQTAQQLWQRACCILPALARYSPVQHWAGLRPGSVNNWPYIGPGPLPNLWLNCGHFRYGITLATGSVALLLSQMQQSQPEPNGYGWQAELSHLL